MEIRLYINNFKVDLYSNQKFGYKKQVNSLKDLASRQTNYSLGFKVPKTAHNILGFEGLGMNITGSELPYKKVPARLFVGNICMILKGWAQFMKTFPDYLDITIYDGNIDFFKTLDNIEFDEIPLPELSHKKDLSTIVSNWNNSSDPYTYLAADYNGRTHFIDAGTNYLNIDYLIPSVNISFLWQRIFETFGFEYSGDVFQEPEFLDTFLTFPKGIVAGEVSQSALSVQWGSQKVFYNTRYPQWLFSRTFSYDDQVNEGQIIDNPAGNNMKAFQITETGLYKITVTGTVENKSKRGVEVYLRLGKNLDGQRESDIDTSTLQDKKSIIKDIPEGVGEVAINYDETLEVSAGETFTIIYYTGSRVKSDNTKFDLDWNISQVNKESVDQVKFFKGLSPKDFFREIMWRFGLTPFSSKNENKLEFLTWEQRINGPTEDWSDRFISKVSEEYVYDAYAKENYYRFKYSNEGDDFNDGVIRIDNENLKDNATLLKSKTYSVEQRPVNYSIGGSQYLVPKMELWEKDIKDNSGTIELEYKARDSRFYFIRELEINGIAKVGSQQLNKKGTANKVRTARNWNYSNQEIINNRYKEVGNIFNKTKIITIELLMSAIEFDQFDLKPTVFIKQLGAEFLVDSITKKDLNSKITQAELIKINR
ncbi:hypothetical protein SAMN05444483_10989 [Salegentibacter echinorum]|uniref:Uncharacterized protein n=1 Tax=Salegentibacter echinorum TaxID=1073325 RepID=A0A1M5J2K6_SALEC|nr:hypothetical protein [Salegentibacter echinorum]SHG34794.1 hypothetical protein SAMN05444483_10989 [Salegentibacter echinorum]